jgi:protein-S-isoprenylcysteine O-methyltransferase Ste14
MRSLFFYRGYFQALYVAVLVLYVWFFPPDLGNLNPLLDGMADVLSAMILTAGAFLRMWAVSYPGKHTRSRTIQAPALVTTGPYACVRNPIYLANFLIGLGLVVISDAFLLVPVYFVLFGLPYRRIVKEEEAFLQEKFGAEFKRYCQKVHRWLPRFNCPPILGSNLHLKEFGTTFGILFGAVFFEWIESPQHRGWIEYVLNSLAAALK